MIKLRPEINELKYWLHLIVITIIVLFILNLLNITDILINLKNIILISLAIGVADIVAHTVLKLD